ncbi:MAG: hypothetical protein K6F39_01765 [Lachnospiraceae bacterium]|nr:hypothetical protein [Lachnospiraceae bacterium]
MILIRDQIKTIYSRYAVYIDPALKFILALITYIAINGSVGHMRILKNPVLVFLVALLNAVLPASAILPIACMSVILHMYSISLLCAVIVGALFTLLFLLYFRFAPKDSVLVLVTPLAFIFHIPYAVPICAGLLGNAYSCVSVVCGVVAYYVVIYVAKSGLTIEGTDIEKITAALRTFFSGITGNKTMILVLVAFAATTLLVYLIRRLSIDYAWYLAIGSGVVTDFLIILIGNSMMNLEVSLLALFIGSIIAVPIALIVKFFCFYPDYAKTELLQFEDDEYYYYVKAVPKLSVISEKGKSNRSAERNFRRGS